MGTTDLYFSTVVALPDDSAVVGGHLVQEKASPTGTLLIHLTKGKWILVAKVPGVVNALTMGRRLGTEQMVGVLGRDGYFAEVSVVSKQVRTETTVPIQIPGYLEDVVFFQGVYFVCGAHRQVHQFDGRIWNRVDSDIYEPADVPKEFLLSMHAGQRLYASGAKGFAAKLDSASWTRFDSPTNVDLNAVLSSSDGSVLFAGGGGLLFRFLPDGSWHQIAMDLYPDAIFWSIDEFQGAIYLAAGNKVFRLVGEQLEPVDLPFSRQIEVYSLAASSNSLWLVGDECVYQYTGERWLEHVSPSNRR